MPACWKTLAVLVCCALAAPGRAATYAELVAFGDSLSDMGNRSLSAKKPPVRFRPTWIAQLAGPGLLDIAGFKPSGMSSYYGGSNYAVGGATTEYAARLGSERNRGQNLTQQVSKRYLRPAFNTGGVKKEALHVIVIGANDLMLEAVTWKQLFGGWAELDQAGVAIARSTEGQIQALASAGVTHVLWGNLFDTGRPPSIASRARWLGATRSAVALAALTRATRAHNAEMDAAIARLEKANPSLRIVKLDLFAVLADIIDHPAKFGLSDVTHGANDDQHLFSADGLHPTPRGHRILAEYAFGVLSAPAR